MIVLLRSFGNIFRVPDLRRKVFFTLGVLAVYRFGVHVPIPGVNTTVLNGMAGGMGTGLMAYLDLFSGGALRHFAVFALGMVPYINASIMMQILSVTLPQLERLAKEGNYGRYIINQYTRYLALALSLVQGFGLAMYVENLPNLAITPGWSFRLTTMFILSVGAMFVMWLGEQINAHGIGNGSSMIIFAGIISGLPAAIIKVVNDIQMGQNDPLLAVVLLALTIAVVMCVVFLEKGERRIPIHYARKVVGNRMYGGQSSYIPLKLNSASVIPVIFSGSIMSMLLMMVKFGADRKWTVFEFLGEQLMWTAPLNWILTAALIIVFAYFYTALIFNPVELADNIRKSGGFIPSIRPGKRTADFFDYILTRVCLPGAIYLAALAILPRILQMKATFPVMFDGTSLLIVVGVALDASAQIESYLIERRYEGFLSSGRLKGRLGK